MLHGFAPAILEAVPASRVASPIEIQWAVPSIRQPGLDTVRRTLHQLEAEGLVVRESGGYRRLEGSA